MPSANSKEGATISLATATRDRAWRQTAMITLAAVGAFLAIRSLPVSGTSLHARDFHAGGKNFFEFCAPGSPQFAPVDRVRSPVAIDIIPDQPPVAGEVIDCSLQMRTATGKPVVADDLFVVHTEKIHLLIINSALDDYQHVHPVAGDEPGEFRFSFRPSRGGNYRMFADFTPRATGRSLYAGAALEVVEASRPASPAETSQENLAATEPRLKTTTAGLEFSLAPAAMPVRINEATDLMLTVKRCDGAPLRLEEVMGAAAHVVAFDAGLSGFAHLHPAGGEKDGLSQTAIGALVEQARLQFAVEVSDPGYYRLWAQLKIDGEEVFAPFDLHVRP